VDGAPRIFPLGENALTIEFGNEISVELNKRVHAISRTIEKYNFEGFIECVPAYSTLTIFYDVAKVRRAFPKSPSAFAAISEFAEKHLAASSVENETAERHITIPVCFENEFAPDLGEVARAHSLSRESVIEIFLSRSYRVFMLGFLPGFPYMGEVDSRIATPRKETPRLKVARGSVGIAGSQTGIYPTDSPGGWQIIGKTPTRIFLPDEFEITLFKPGDEVTFSIISREEFSRVENS
jgi:inhibitor of KinA